MVGFRIEGTISAGDVLCITEAIEARLERHRKLRIYAEVERLSGMTAEALIKDLAFSLRHLRDFEREAIVSDAAWLKTLAHIGDRIFKSIEVREFSSSEKNDALAWIMDRR